MGKIIEPRQGEGSIRSRGINSRAGQRGRDPLDYGHPYDSMRRYAELLALRHDSARTRHSYYRAMRLVHEHYGADPATLGEDQLRDYILHVKTRKAWRPKTIRQTMACARLFFVEMLGHGEWKVFSQVRTRDHDELPAVLTRPQVASLLGAIRLRRYRTPVKLIYCAGLRLSEPSRRRDRLPQAARRVCRPVAGRQINACRSPCTTSSRPRAS